MKLLTEEIKASLPPLYSSEQNPDPLVVCKFFHPASQWTWYVTEGDPVDVDGFCCRRDQPDFITDWLLFGLVVGLETELGYFQLSELEGYGGRGLRGLPIERDLYWEPQPLSKVRESLERSQV